MKRCVIILAAWLICTGGGWTQALGQAETPQFEFQLKYRWVFTMTNLASEEALQKTLSLIERAKRAGYNGILLTDSKFAKFQLQQKHYP